MQLRVILETVEIVLHVTVEQGGVHRLRQRINKHVICRNPSDGVLEILNPFPDIKQIQSNTFLFGGAGRFDTSIIQGLAIGA